MQARMSNKELALYMSFLKHSERYIEFGTGGSTVVASEHVKSWIISVDSSQGWLDKVLGACAGKKTIPEMKFIDIGKTGEWGMPIEPSRIQSWPSYHSSIWNSRTSEADLYLVDGRFRVACFAQIVLHCRPDAIIGFHDFTSRPHYHRVKEIAREVASAEDMSLFQPLPNVGEQAYRILAEYMTSPK